MEIERKLELFNDMLEWFGDHDLEEEVLVKKFGISYAELNELGFDTPNSNHIETFSSGGGCWHSVRNIGKLQYVVSNDFPKHLCIYNVVADDKYPWYLENIVQDIDMKTCIDEDMMLIYAELLNNLKRCAEC